MLGYASYFKDLVGDEKILGKESIIKIFHLYEKIFSKIRGFKQLLDKVKQKFDFNIDKAILHAYENFIKENSDNIYNIVKNTNQFKTKEDFLTWSFSRFPMYEFFSTVLEKQKTVKIEDLKDISEDELYALFKTIVDQSRNVKSIYSLGHIDSTILDFLAVNFFSGNGYLIFFLENYLQKESKSEVEEERKEAETYVSNLLKKYYKDKTSSVSAEEQILLDREKESRKEMFRQKMREVRDMIVSPVKNLVSSTYEKIREASPILRFFEWGAKSMIKLSKMADERFNKGRLWNFLHKAKSGKIFPSLFKKKKGEMSKEDFEKLRNELSENIYRKKYSQLSDQEKEKIDKIANLIKNEKQKKAEIVESILEAKNIKINQDTTKDYNLDDKETKKTKKTKEKTKSKPKPETQSKIVSKTKELIKEDEVKQTPKESIKNKFARKLSKTKETKKKEKLAKVFETEGVFCRNIMSPTAIQEEKTTPILAQEFPKAEEQEKDYSLKDTLSEVYDNLDKEDKKYEKEGETDIQDITRKRSAKTRIKDYIRKTGKNVKEQLGKIKNKIKGRFLRTRLGKKTASKVVRKVPKSGLQRVRGLFKGGRSMLRPNMFGSRVPGGGGMLNRLGSGFGRLGGAVSRAGSGLVRAVGSIGRVGSILSRAGPILGFFATPAGWIVLAVIIALTLLAVGTYIYYLFKKIKYMIDPVIEMAYGKGAKSAFEAEKLAKQEEKFGENLKKRLDAVRDVQVSQGTKGFLSEYSALSSGDLNEQNVYTQKEPTSSQTQTGAQTQKTGQSQQTQGSQTGTQQTAQQKQAQQTSTTTQNDQQKTSSPEAEQTRKLTQESLQAIQQRAEARSGLVTMSENVSTKGTMALDHSQKSNPNSEY
ncbi:MAG: hypothetical protein NZZ41_06845 [Candidatus Dojkabacteria bacterium]|nr:hypothetical protein [Candidatus Dojkabacteria bacterium]